jgi:VanZ family protein
MKMFHFFSDRLKRNTLFQIALFLAVISITYLAFKHKPLESNYEGGDKIHHLLAFFVLAFLLEGSFDLWARHFWLKVTILLSYGLFIEFVQWFIPSREFSLLDILADLSGAIIYYFIAILIKFILNQFKKSVI